MLGRYFVSKSTNVTFGVTLAVFEFTTCGSIAYTDGESSPPLQTVPEFLGFRGVRMNPAVFSDRGDPEKGRLYSYVGPHHMRHNA